MPEDHGFGDFPRKESNPSSGTEPRGRGVKARGARRGVSFETSRRRCEVASLRSQRQRPSRGRHKGPLRNGTTSGAIAIRRNTLRYCALRSIPLCLWRDCFVGKSGRLATTGNIVIARPRQRPKQSRNGGSVCSRFKSLRGETRRFIEGTAPGLGGCFAVFATTKTVASSPEQRPHRNDGSDGSPTASKYAGLS